MQPWMISVLIASVVVIAFVVRFVYHQNRSDRLRQRFGPEYDRAISEVGSRHRAESELARREAHAIQIRDRQMNPMDRDRFLSHWKLCQAQFVDNPSGALERADELLVEAMGTRGYSIDPHDRVTDIAAAYPHHADRYRDACRILARRRSGEASTGELRTAFLHYRTLFDDLLGGYEETLRRAS